DVLSRLRPSWEGRFRCIYIDPPYNTGRAFAEYNDALTPSAWDSMMKDRLHAMWPLLSDEGAIFAEIDDSELDSLCAILNKIFGEHNRISIVSVVRSGATGHKAINRGPVNVTDFLLIYAKDKKKWRPNRQFRRRMTFDNAYSTFLTNPDSAV